MGDVCEGAAVHQAGGALQGLHQVGLDGVLHQGGHGALGLQVPGIDRLVLIVIGHQDIAEALLQVLQVRSQAQNGHDLRGHGDHEMILPGDAVGLSAQAHDDVAQGAVIHVHDPGENDPAGVDAQGVALLQVVVDHGAQQVVGGGDGVHIAGEVQVDVLHGDHLGITAAGGAALHAEHGPQRRLPQGDDGVFSDARHGLAQANGGGGLALACGRGVDGGHQDQLAVGLVLQARHGVGGDLCLVAAVQLQLLLPDAGLFGDFGNGLHPAALGDLNVGHHVRSLQKSCRKKCPVFLSVYHQLPPGAMPKTMIFALAEKKRLSAPGQSPSAARRGRRCGPRCVPPPRSQRRCCGNPPRWPGGRP